ncbi:hypothetical protein [Rufibacter immobilis]|uniref:hypothetical protein n=1 Tax=Rufibacter immobilis TaxID=1348778 RepID=UPI0035E5F92E
MTNFFQEYDKESTPITSDMAEPILNELAEQIDEQWRTHKIDAIVTRSTSSEDNKIVLALYLNVGYKRKFYNYRFIEVKQPFDEKYPVIISAFQSPPTPEEKIKDGTKLREKLIKIIGDPRTKIVKHHLVEMRENIKQWVDEAVEEGDDNFNGDSE